MSPARASASAVRPGLSFQHILGIPLCLPPSFVQRQRRRAPNVACGSMRLSKWTFMRAAHAHRPALNGLFQGRLPMAADARAHVRRRCIRTPRRPAWRRPRRLLRPSVGAGIGDGDSPSRTSWDSRRRPGPRSRRTSSRERDLGVRPACRLSSACMMVEQVALQQGQHHLGLRVAEAAVVLDDLGAVLGQHQAEVKAALEGAGPRRSWRAMVGRKISSMHRLGDLRRCSRGWARWCPCRRC